MIDFDQVAKGIHDFITISDSKDLNKIKRSGGLKEQIQALLNLIPIGGGFLAQEYSILNDYHNFEFFRKFTTFVLSLSDISAEEREEFSEEIDEKAEDYSGNVLMSLVDRLDNINKARILSNIVIARINKSITIEAFFRLSSMLERIPYVDLTYLPKYIDDYYDESGDTELLFSTGALIQTEISEVGSSKYKLSLLGQQLLKWGMRTDLDVKQSEPAQITLNTASDSDIKDIVLKAFRHN